MAVKKQTSFYVFKGTYLTYELKITMPGKFLLSFASNSVWQLTKNSPSNVFPGDAKDPEILGSMSPSPPNYEDGHFHFLEETVFLPIQNDFHYIQWGGKLFNPFH